jgi:quercetin dioxygenase-like cupin family protein
LITKEDGAENFAMRCFEIMPGGQSAHHAHNWEHEAFVLDGQELVVCGDKEDACMHGRKQKLS